MLYNRQARLIPEAWLNRFCFCFLNRCKINSITHTNIRQKYNYHYSHPFLTHTHTHTRGYCTAVEETVRTLNRCVLRPAALKENEESEWRSQTVPNRWTSARNRSMLLCLQEGRQRFGCRMRIITESCSVVYARPLPQRQHSVLCVIV